MICRKCGLKLKESFKKNKIVYIAVGIVILLILICVILGNSSGDDHDDYDDDSYTVTEQTEIPKYDTIVKVKSVTNVMFSTYDIKIYVDEQEQGTIKNGEFCEYQLTLEEGEHTLTVCSTDDDSVKGETTFDVYSENKLQFKIYSTSDEISIETEDYEEETTEITTESTTKETTAGKVKKENLTIDNCPELAAILSNKAEIDDTYSAFASKYKGRIIEFDGRIDYCTKHENYNTRFDYLVSAGNYNPDSQIGPTFKFEDVNYYDLNTDMETVSVGLNVHIVAEVDSFDNNSGLFYLKPVSVTSR